MIFQLSQTTVTTSFEFTKGDEDYIVQWRRIITGSKDDIRHRITVLKNHGNVIDEKYDRVVDTDFIVHQHLPTEKRSKKYLKLAIETA